MKNFVFLMSFILFIPSLAYAQNLPGYWGGGTGGENKSPYSQPYPRTYPEDYRTVRPSLPGYFNPEAGSTTPYSSDPRGLAPLTPNPYQPPSSQRQR
jgi:hypothetical protein